MINLVSIDKRMIEEWHKYFDNISDINIVYGSIFDIKCDAIATPGNSYGFMDGGLDLLVANYFKNSIENEVQKKIIESFNGFLIVGQALSIKTNNKDIPYLIYAPTMEIPMKIDKSINVYLAMKAILNIYYLNKDIKTISIPALGTGTGGLDYEICAMQMKEAYIDFNNNYFPKDLEEAIKKRKKLKVY